MVLPVPVPACTIRCLPLAIGVVDGHCHLLLPRPLLGGR